MILTGLSVFVLTQMEHSRNGDGKEFVSDAPGYWPQIAPELWNDWKWQLKNRVTSLVQLESGSCRIHLSDEERSGVLLSGDKLALAVTPHFFNLIPREKNPDDPIRDRKSTRLNSSHSQISYAVFCLKK